MHYALNKTYPIDTEEQVKTASAYFDKYINRFGPVQRSVIATNMEKRATDLGINLDSEWIENYSRITKEASVYSPDFERNMLLRKEACKVGKVKIKVNNKKMDGDKVLEKISSQKSLIAPKEMANLIADFDKIANLEALYDDRIYDPIFTVFGSNYNSGYDRVKVASGLSERDLKTAANNQCFIEKIAASFGDAFANDFKAQPVEIFESMPFPEKSLIMEKIAESKDEEDDEDKEESKKEDEKKDKDEDKEDEKENGEKKKKNLLEEI